MNLTRRGFLKTCLALAAAPAVVRAESLMKLWVPPQKVILPQAAAIPDGEVIIWSAQFEAGLTQEEKLFSSFIKVGDEPAKRVSMRAIVPAGVSPRVVIRKDGTLDIEGGINKTTMESEYPVPVHFGRGYHMTSDYISQPVLPMPDECVYQPLLSGTYAATPSHAQNAIFHSEDFTQSVWTTGRVK